MARWFVYEVQWKRGVPPFAKNLHVANARLQRIDYDAPLLTEKGFVHRWRNPTVTARDVYRILHESNAQPGIVNRWECKCDDWGDCAVGLTECGQHRAHRGENEEDDRCYWFDENSAKFYESNRPTRILKEKRNPSKWPVEKRRARANNRMQNRTTTDPIRHNRTFKKFGR